MPPYIFPQQPDPSKDPGKKLGAGDLFNLDEIKRQLSSSLSEAFKASMQERKSENQKIIRDLKQAETEYINYVSTAQRKKYNELLKNQDKVKQALREQRAQEATSIRESLKGEEQKAQRVKALTSLRLEHFKKLANVEKVKASEISAAGKQAWLSEHPMIAKAAGKIPGVGGALAGGASLGATAATGGLLVITALLKELFKLGTLSAETATQLRNVGVETGTLGESTLPLVNKALSNLASAASPLLLTQEDQLKVMGKLSKSTVATSSILADNSKGFTQFAGLMGNFGVTIDQSADIFVEASNQYGASTEELTNTFKVARAISKSTNLTFNQAFHSMLRMREAMQLTVGTGKTAEVAVSNLYKSFAIGMQGFSPSMVSRFAESFGNLVGNLKPSQLAGLIAFNTGKAPTSKELYGRGGKAGEDLLQFGKKLISAVPEDQRAYAIESMAQQGYLPQEASTIKGAEAFEKFLTNSAHLTGKAAEEAFKKFQEANKTPEQTLDALQRDGFTALKGIEGPIKGLENLIKDLVQSFVKVFLPNYITLSGRAMSFMGHDYKSDLRTIGSAFTDGTISGAIGSGAKSAADFAYDYGTFGVGPALSHFTNKTKDRPVGNKR